MALMRQSMAPSTNHDYTANLPHLDLCAKVSAVDPAASASPVCSLSDRLIPFSSLPNSVYRDCKTAQSSAQQNSGSRPKKHRRSDRFSVFAGNRLPEKIRRQLPGGESEYSDQHHAKNGTSGDDSYHLLPIHSSKSLPRDCGPFEVTTQAPGGATAPRWGSDLITPDRAIAPNDSSQPARTGPPSHSNNAIASFPCRADATLLRRSCPTR